MGKVPTIWRQTCPNLLQSVTSLLHFFSLFFLRKSTMIRRKKRSFQFGNWIFFLLLYPRPRHISSSLEGNPFQEIKRNTKSSDSMKPGVVAFSRFKQIGLRRSSLRWSSSSFSSLFMHTISRMMKRTQRSKNVGKGKGSYFGLSGITWGRIKSNKSNYRLGT